MKKFPASDEIAYSVFYMYMCIYSLYIDRMPPEAFSSVSYIQNILRSQEDTGEEKIFHVVR